MTYLINGLAVIGAVTVLVTLWAVCEHICYRDIEAFKRDRGEK